MVDFGTPVSQKLMDRSSRISGSVDGCKGLFTLLSFFRVFKGCCQGNQLKSKNQHFPWTNNLLCRTVFRKLTAISQFWFQKVQQNKFLYIVYNVGGIWSRNLRVYTVNNSTFCGDNAKNRHITPNISRPGTLLWQPVKYGRCSQTSRGRTFTLCFGIRQLTGRS